MPAECQSTAADLLADLVESSLTLDEYLTSVSLENVLSLRVGGESFSDRWLYAAAAGDYAAFNRRLGWDRRKDRAAGEGLEWITWFAQAMAQVPIVASELRSQGHLAEEELFSDGEPVAFLELWVPFLRVARERLSSAVGHWLGQLSVSARNDLERRLLTDLSARGALTAYASFDRWRTGAAPGVHLYQTFVEGHLAGGWANFFSRYAVLARRLATATALWVTSVAELVTRLATDRVALEQQFADGKSLGIVVQLDTALSEPHGGGRRVMALTFPCGRKVVYKPRPVAMEAAFQDLLDWLATQGLGCAPESLRIISRSGYGWSEWLEPSVARNRTQVDRYFERAGALLCLVELLGGDDLHAENVVATAKGPLLIDAETLFQPQIDAEPSATAHRLRSQLATSVQLDVAGASYDLGGLQGHARRLAESRRPVWCGPNTDAMVLEEYPAFVGPGPNVLFWRGRPCLPATHLGALARGFAATYRFLLSHRLELLADEGPLSSFRSGSTRVLLRGSQQYAELLVHLREVRFQSSGLAGDLLVEAGNRQFSCDRQRPRGWDAIAEERRMLLAGDVPRFEVRVDGTEIQLANGQSIPGCFSVSGFQAAHTRIERMSEEDLVGWLREIRLLKERKPELRQSGPQKPLEGSSDPIEQAKALGRHLAMGSPSRRGRGERGLYGGSLGLAVFAAALARQTGDSQLRTQALVLAQAELRRPLPGRRGAGVEIGGFAGVGGDLYAASLLSSWLEVPVLVEMASRRIRRIESPVLDHAKPDLAAGLAGCVLGALAFAESTGDPAAQALAAAAGERLATRIEEMAIVLPGVAHGFAGIALALLRLAASTGDRSWIEPARRAWEREWQVRAAAPGFLPTLARHGQGWCRGSAGVGLVALELLRAQPGADRPVELSVAIATVREIGMSDLDSPCCGAPGELDLLFAARRSLPLSSLADRWEHLRTHWWKRLATSGPQLDRDRRGSKQSQASLFRGWAGVGYQLLRTHQPDRWPSILMFEPPVRSGPLQEVIC